MSGSVRTNKACNRLDPALLHVGVTKIIIRFFQGFCSVSILLIRIFYNSDKALIAEWHNC